MSTETDPTTLRTRALIKVLQGRAEPPPGADWMDWLEATGRVDETVDAAFREAAEGILDEDEEDE